MNLIVIHAHDMGCYCSPYMPTLSTPHLQSFADRATLFTNAHCAAPTCSPSRAAMLTGLTAHETGMMGLLHRGFHMHDESQHLAHLLRQNGYQTALAGVQHELRDPGIAYHKVMAPDHPDLLERDQMAACAAVDFLQHRQTQKPFFLWFGLFYPHRPFSELSGDEEMDSPNIPPLFPDNRQIRNDMLAYQKALSIADTAIGRLISAVQESTFADNTAIVITTDHGIAFPKMKCRLTGHGTGVTLMIDFPGNPKRGQKMDSLVSHLDLFPTLLVWAGIAPPQSHGHSLLPCWSESNSTIRDDLFAEINHHVDYEPTRSVRTLRTNYIRHYGPHLRQSMANIDDSPTKSVLMADGYDESIEHPREELYDLTSDPQETRNLAKEPEMQEVLDEMRSRLNEWMLKTNDPLLHDVAIRT